MLANIYTKLVMDSNLSNFNNNIPSTGTTIAATVYKDGVILACDTRMTLGRYICSRAATKISQLTSHVYMARSGSAGHTQIIGDYGIKLIHAFK